jgi:hypothetical protein
MLKTLGNFGVNFTARRNSPKIPETRKRRRRPRPMVRCLLGDAISGSQVRAVVRPSPGLRKPAPFRRRARKPPSRPFLAISSSHFSVSAESIRSPGRFRPAGLRPQKSRSRRGRGAEARHLGVAMVFQFPGVRVPRNYLHHQSFRTGQFPIGFR